MKAKRSIPCSSCAPTLTYGHSQWKLASSEGLRSALEVRISTIWEGLLLSHQKEPSKRFGHLTGHTLSEAFYTCILYLLTGLVMPQPMRWRRWLGKFGNLDGWMFFSSSRISIESKTPRKVCMFSKMWTHSSCSILP